MEDSNAPLWGLSDGGERSVILPPICAEPLCRTPGSVGSVGVSFLKGVSLYGVVLTEWVFIYRSVKRSLILDVKVRRPVLLRRSTPMLFEVISVIAPAVLLNSRGMFTFLKKVS